MSILNTLTVVRESRIHAKDKLRIERLLRLIAMSSADMSSSQLTAARIAAGLNQYQAARLLTERLAITVVSADTQLDLERTWSLPVDPEHEESRRDFVAAFDDMYGLGPKGK